LRRATAGKDEIEKLRPIIERVVASRSSFAMLATAVKQQLLDDVVDAVGFAKAGLADILEGKRAKPDAWMGDIFVMDICRALDRAGIPVREKFKAEESHAQSFARAVADAVRLPLKGQLRKQMRRARQITRRPLSDIDIEYTPVLPGDIQWSDL